MVIKGLWRPLSRSAVLAGMARLAWLYRLAGLNEHARSVRRLVGLAGQAG